MRWTLILASVLLVLCSGFFSSSEIAYATMNRLRMEAHAEQGSRSAKLALYISDHFAQFLSTVLVGNNLVNIAFSSIMTVIAIGLFPKSASLYATLLTTVILLIFGEICPKIVASAVSDPWAMIVSVPLRVLMILFAPVVLLVSWIVEKLSPIWTPKNGEDAITDEDLVTMVDTIEDEGVFTEREGDLIKSAIELTDTTAKEILIPRVDVAAFDIEDPLDELLESEELMNYSRIPVFEDSIDNIIGILSTKNLMKTVLTEGKDHVDLRALLTPPLFVHKTKSVSDLLRELRKSHLQMAVVVDEFGGTLGILTMEDILEEVVGEIYDETDDVEQEVVASGDNSFLVDGSTNIEDMFETIGYEPHDFESEYTTAGGWATEILDKLPEEGDSFDWNRLHVTVEKVDSMRVETLRVVVQPEEETQEETDSVS